MKVKIKKGIGKREFQKQWVLINRDLIAIKHKEYYQRESMNRHLKTTSRANANDLKKAVMEAMSEHHAEKFYTKLMSNFLKETLSTDANIKDQNEDKKNMEDNKDE